MKDNRINEIAFEWLVRADGGLSSTEQAELDVWLASDSRHYGAFIRAKAVFSQAGRAKAFGCSADPIEWLRTAQPTEQFVIEEIPTADNDKNGFERVSRRAFLGLAGVVAVAGSALTFLATGQSAQALTFRTNLGELRDIILADGTKVSLNTDSEISVLFKEKMRTVELVRGEVLFDVAHEADRPFEVNAIGFQARAIGTRFAIRQIRGVAPQLVVQDGVVAVTPSHSTSMRVAANTRITVFARGKVLRKMLTQGELDRELMWREGKIAFDDTPLRNAISAFDRYGSVPIKVEDAQLLNHTVTGVFSSDDPMGFAKVVAEVFDLDAVPEGRGIILRKKR